MRSLGLTKSAPDKREEERWVVEKQNGEHNRLLLSTLMGHTCHPGTHQPVLVLRVDARQIPHSGVPAAWVIGPDNFGQIP